MIDDVHNFLNRIEDKESALEVVEELNNLALMLLLESCEQVRLHRIAAAESCRKDFKPLISPHSLRHL